MATSSSEGSVQNDFDITSSLEESNGKYCFSCERCPLCLTPKRRYYCKYCIRSGDFVHSRNTDVIKESFSEKKSRQMKLKRERLLALSNLTIVLDQYSKADKIKTQINDCKEKIRLYKLSIADVQQEVIQMKKNSIVMFNSTKKRRLELADNNKRLCQVKDKEQTVSKTCKEMDFALIKKRKKLKRISKIRVNELVESIFSISRVSFEEPQEDSLNQATICALAEATQTAFVCGRWIYTENSGNIFYRIIEALLPANGDYSLYNTWVASNRDLIPSLNTVANIHQHQAYGISSALTYFCQLVSLIAFYLNIWLPHRLCYSEFCSQDMIFQDFQSKVAKLNANVLHLCLLQNVDPQILSTQSCAANLTHLLNPAYSDLGRIGPIEISDFVNYNLNAPIENSAEEIENLEEWEEINDPDIQIPKQIKHNYVLPPETANAAGGLMQSAVASISSFWKAATGDIDNLLSLRT